MPTDPQGLRRHDRRTIQLILRSSQKLGRNPPTFPTLTRTPTTPGQVLDPSEFPLFRQPVILRVRSNPELHYEIVISDRQSAVVPIDANRPDVITQQFESQGWMGRIFQPKAIFHSCKALNFDGERSKQVQKFACAFDFTAYPGDCPPECPCAPG